MGWASVRGRRVNELFGHIRTLQRISDLFVETAEKEARSTKKKKINKISFFPPLVFKMLILAVV